MISKILFLLFLVVLVWWLVRRGSRAGRPRRRDGDDGGGRTQVASMCRCAHCGLFLPQGEAVRRHGRDYCCPEHADEARREGEGGW